MSTRRNVDVQSNGLRFVVYDGITIDCDPSDEGFAALNNEWDMKPRNELKAPKGKCRVIGVDTFEGPFADYLIGDYKSCQYAKKQVYKNGGVMNRVYCYDENGKLLYEAGTF